MGNILRTVTLDRASRRKDKSVSLTFITDMEQSTEQFMEIDKLISHSGVVYFKAVGEISEEELQAIEDSKFEFSGKKKHEILDSILYKLWVTTKPVENYGDFYKSQYNKFIKHIGDQIPE